MIINARPTRWKVGNKDGITVVEIADEGGGEFVSVDQPLGTADTFRWDPEEWPAIRDAIDNAFAEIKRHEDVEKVGEN